MKSIVLILLLLTSMCQLNAQNQFISFDSLKKNGTVIINLGRITRAQANRKKILVEFKNISKNTMFANSETTAWYDISDFGRYASHRVPIKPNQKGCFTIELRLGERKQINYFGNLDFTNMQNKLVVTYRINLLAEVYDTESLNICNSYHDYDFDTVHHIYLANYNEKINLDGQLKIEVENLYTDTIIVKNKKVWDTKTGTIKDKDTKFSNGRLKLAGDTIPPSRIGFLYIEPYNYKEQNVYATSKDDIIEYDIIDKGHIIESRKFKYNFSANIRH